MKILFLTTNNISDINGGGRASARNVECLEEIYGKGTVEIQQITESGRRTLKQRAASFLRKLLFLRLYPSFKSLGISPLQYDVVFVDGSSFGSHIHSLKRKAFTGKTIAFFHNCNADYKAMFVSGKRSFGAWLYMKAIRYNEEMTLREADACVFINERDMERCIDIYGIKPKSGKVITMTMKDAYREVAIEDKEDRRPLYTVLGSYFKPNVDGIKWFVKNVLPYVDIRLRIVGKDMHLLQDEIDSSGIEIFSNVSDLSPFMAESDYMLYPIFEGSGMKIKTCEALMWGKNIVGTPEAFSGYGITDYSKIGACCETAKEFIEAIQTLSMPKFNAYSRRLYKDCFSHEKAVEQYRQLFLEIN